MGLASLLFVFQSPERIHAFGNLPLQMYGTMPVSFNPQRGFMLLGTSANLDLMQDSTVSIPREDSCFWELMERSS